MQTANFIAAFIGSMSLFTGWVLVVLLPILAVACSLIFAVFFRELDNDDAQTHAYKLGALKQKKLRHAHPHRHP